MVRKPPANAGDIRDAGVIPGWGRPPGGGQGKPLLYSRLENLLDRGAWRATVLGVAKSWTQPKRLSTQHGAATTGLEGGEGRAVRPARVAHPCCRDDRGF